MQCTHYAIVSHLFPSRLQLSERMPDVPTGMVGYSVQCGHLRKLEWASYWDCCLRSGSPAVQCSAVQCSAEQSSAVQCTGSPAHHPRPVRRTVRSLRMPEGPIALLAAAQRYSPGWGRGGAGRPGWAGPAGCSRRCAPGRRSRAGGCCSPAEGGGGEGTKSNKSDEN
jgi:hypothetical protein